MKPNRRPPLTAVVVADPDRLGEAIDAVVLADAVLQRLQRRAVRQAQRLRGLLDEEQWASVMAFEEVLNQRWARSLGLVAGVFFHAGVRQGRRVRRDMG